MTGFAAVLRSQEVLVSWSAYGKWFIYHSLVKGKTVYGSAFNSRS